VSNQGSPSVCPGVLRKNPFSFEDTIWRDREAHQEGVLFLSQSGGNPRAGGNPNTIKENVIELGKDSKKKTGRLTSEKEGSESRAACFRAEKIFPNRLDLLKGGSPETGRAKTDWVMAHKGGKDAKICQERVFTNIGRKRVPGPNKGKGRRVCGGKRKKLQSLRYIRFFCS